MGRQRPGLAVLSNLAIKSSSHGSPAALDNATDIVWDSGKVVSSGPIRGSLCGSGRARKDKSEYWWKVRTWDAQGQAFALERWPPLRHLLFFKPAGWKPAGRLDRRWARDRSPPPKPSPQFRKEFQINKPIRGAYLYICGLGQFTTLINGARVGDHVMDPAWTDYDETADYVTFDVTSMVGQGGNAIGVMLANGWLCRCQG